MDNKRLHKKNQLVDEIKQIDLTMSRDISSIDKLKHSRMEIAFVQNSIIKINLKVEDKKLRKKQLQEDLVKLDQGELDDDIQSEYNKSKLLINQKNEEHKHKRAMIAQQKADDEEKYWYYDMKLLIKFDDWWSQFEELKVLIKQTLNKLN